MRRVQKVRPAMRRAVAVSGTDLVATATRTAASRAAVDVPVAARVAAVAVAGTVVAVGSCAARAPQAAPAVDRPAAARKAAVPVDSPV
jgi:hypothetical protein